MFLVLSAFLIRLPVSRPVLKPAVSESPTRLARFSVFCVSNTKNVQPSACCVLASYDSVKIVAPSLLNLSVGFFSCRRLRLGLAENVCSPLVGAAACC